MSRSSSSSFSVFAEDEASGSSPPTTPDSSPRKPRAATAPALPPLPSVHIPARTMSPALAARMAMATVGHVLFLKDQIPYPMRQMSRVQFREAQRGVSTKNFKKRGQALDAFDVLTTDLYGTFAELGRALARNPGRLSQPGSTSQHLAVDSNPTATAHLFVVLGSTVANARSRVLLALDGLDIPTVITGNAADHSELEGKTDENAHGLVAIREDAAGRIPLGRKDRDPSPELADDLPVGAAQWDANSGIDSGDESSDIDLASTSDGDDLRGGTITLSEPALTLEQQRLLAEEEDLFTECERRLSLRVNGDELFYNSVPATNTFVLLRAPRCFKHPEWVPSPRFQKTLDAQLAAPKEGIHVYCGQSLSADYATDEVHEIEAQSSDEDEDNEHQLIWWLWAGKFVGFEELIASG